MNLKRLRNKVDEIDERIIQLLNSRANIAKIIAKTKLGDGKSVYSPDRELEVLKKISSSRNETDYLRCML